MKIIFIIIFLLFKALAFDVVSYGAENIPAKQNNDTISTPKETTQPVTEITQIKPSVTDRLPAKIVADANPKSTPEKRERKEEKSQESWLAKLTNDPIAFFTLVLAVATFLLWWTTRKLVINAEKTAEQQLRAYLFAKVSDAPIEINDDGIITVTIGIRNFGQTPAQNMETCFHIGIYSLPINTGNPLDDPCYSQDGSKSPLAPSEIVYQKESILKRKPSQDYISLIESGSHALFAVGEIKYVDIFKKNHCTNFCLFSVGNRFRNRTFSYYKTGNHAY